MLAKEVYSCEQTFGGLRPVTDSVNDKFTTHCWQISVPTLTFQSPRTKQIVDKFSLFAVFIVNAVFTNCDLRKQLL